MKTRLLIGFALWVIIQAATLVHSQESISGTIDNETPFIRYPITVPRDGETIIADIRPFDGDLDTVLYLLDSDENIVDQNDDRSKVDTSSRIEFRQATAGSYTLIATRYKMAEGDSAGNFELTLETQQADDLEQTYHVTQEDLVAVGFPTTEPHQEAAWTILVYYGGDNNLESGILNDLDEFEMAGGSTDPLRIVALVDRSPQFTDTNGDWTTARLFELAADATGDHPAAFPAEEVATIDTSPLADLGELDTGDGETLAQFLVWGVQHYPAQHYAVAFGSHGAGWQGLIQDDTSERDLLSIPELQQAFALATAAAGVDKFDLLINDACLMSSVEYYAALALYFRYSIASPEVVVDPALDMRSLLPLLDVYGDVSLAEIGTKLVDLYITRDILIQKSADVTFLTHAITDLDHFDPVTAAVEHFAEIVDQAPAVHSTMLGEARANTYTYTSFLRDNTRIDLGSLMGRVIALSDDEELITAAQAVLAALDGARIYSNGGEYVNQYASYYNIYFPDTSEDFKSEYFEKSPLKEWGRMLRNYYNAVTPQVWTGGGLELGFHLPTEPKIRITSTYPSGVINVHSQVEMKLEIVGRRIAYGEFTVDQHQPNGETRRLSQERLLVDIGTERLNLWRPGVDNATFFWDVTLPVVSDGNSTNNELLIFTEDVAFLNGRYREPGSETWNEVGVIFSLDHKVQRIVNRSNESAALAVITIPAGSEFQAYNAIVTPDKRVTYEPGNTYLWPPDGLTWEWQPAPNSSYDIGLLVTPFGGNTGFAATTVDVNNDGVDLSYYGDLWTDLGINVPRPADWTRLIFFPEFLLRSTNKDQSENITVYFAQRTGSNLNEVAEVFASTYDITLEGEGTPTELNGGPALDIRYIRETAAGPYEGRALAVFKADIGTQGTGMIFAAEALQGVGQLDAAFNLLREHLDLIDLAALAEMNDPDWEIVEDLIPDLVKYPVPVNWLPGVQDGIWRRYTPSGQQDSALFAAIARLETGETDAQTFLTGAVQTYVAPGMANLNMTSLPRTYYGQSYIWFTDEYAVIGGNHVWETALYTGERAGVPIIGRLYATLEEGYAYLLWVEAPDDEQAPDVFASIFEPMLDGFLIGKPSIDD